MSNYGTASNQVAISGLGLKRAHLYEESTKASGITMMETTQKKKPGFFKRWLYKMFEDGWNQIRQEREEREMNSVKMAVGRLNAVDDSPSLNRDKAIRFNVYLANGGRIVEVSRYDRQKDRHVDGLYVITNEQDFGREIDKIITMEHLK